MSNTDCKNVVFIMNEINEIEAETDMWTQEFMKYFTVKKVWKEIKNSTTFYKLL